MIHKALGASLGFFLLALQGGLFAESERLKIIDVHLHMSGVEAKEDGGKKLFEELRREFSEAGVVGGVSHLEEHQAPNPRASELNVIQCFGVGEGLDLAKLESGLSKKVYGCVKIYLGYQYKYAADPFYTPIYRLAEKYRVPVVFHTGDTYDQNGKLKYSDPLTIDEVAVDFRRVTFVIAHMGNPWVQSAVEVAYKNPNVFLEASALMLGDLSKADPQAVEELLVRPLRWAFLYLENPKKLMFGTDWPLVKIEPYVRAYQKAIPEKHWRDVFYNNAVSVFKLEVKWQHGVTDSGH